MGDQLKHLLRGWGPETRVAVCRFTPAASPALQTFLENRGFASVTRTGAGAYTAQLIDTKVKSIEAFAYEIENDTTVRHQTRVDSFSATAGTIAVTHKTSTFATEASAVSVKVTIPDVSTASSTGYGVAPIAGTVAKVYGVLGGAISVGDSVVTTKIAGTNITNGSFTVAQSGSAAGDIDTATPTAANTVTAGQAITAVSDGGSTDAQTEDVYFVIQGSGSTPAGSDTVDQIVIVALYRVMA